MLSPITRYAPKQNAFAFEMIVWTHGSGFLPDAIGHFSWSIFLRGKALVKFKQGHCLTLNHVCDLLNSSLRCACHHITIGELTQHRQKQWPKWSRFRNSKPSKNLKNARWKRGKRTAGGVAKALKTRDDWVSDITQIEGYAPKMSQEITPWPIEIDTGEI